ncbi:MAG: AI-2E family transporter [Eubacteriaceae bacterium]|jgi:predicted PurR-regulated permease PerM
MQNLPWKKNKKYVQAALTVTCLSILLYFILANFSNIWMFIRRVFDILQPILIGVLLAYLMSPICDHMERSLLRFYSSRFKKKETARKWASFTSIALCLIILILIIIALLAMIMPQLSASISDLLNNTGNTEDRFTKILEDNLAYNPGLQHQAVAIWKDISDWIDNYIANTVMPNMNTMLTSVSQQIYDVLRTVFNFFIGIIVSAYCLDRRRVFSLQAKKILFAIFPEEQAEYILGKTDLVNRTFLGFFIGKLIDSAIIGLICFACTMIMGTPHALLVSVIIGVTNIIPFFGPFIGAIPACIIILMSSPLQALYFLIFVFLLQQFDGNILGPKILGNSTGLSSFWVLFSILLFGGLWGIVGMIIAVPLFAIIYNLIKEIVDDHLRKRHLPTQAWAYSNRIPDLDAVTEEEKQQNARLHPDTVETPEPAVEPVYDEETGYAVPGVRKTGKQGSGPVQKPSKNKRQTDSQK